MTLLKQAEAETFIQKRLAQSNGLLLHGGDPAAIQALARLAITTIAAGDPFSEVELSPGEALRDPALLLTEFQSRSLMGGRRIIILRDGGDDLLKVLQPVLDDTLPGNFVLITADTLGKQSKLRKACEEARLFAACAVYEEGPEQLARRVTHYLSVYGLKLSDDARERFFELAGNDRGTVISEAEKLSLYAHGQKEISLADVEAVCGDTAEFDGDDVIDRVMTGDSEAADRAWASLSQQSSGRGILPMLAAHVTRLQALAMDMLSGTPFETAFRNARPMFFFARKGLISSQVRLWDLDALLQAQTTIAGAVLQTRDYAALEEAITSRCLLALARQARALRLRGG
jgi:DNA polymerase-3 subunit delta